MMCGKSFMVGLLLSLATSAWSSASCEQWETCSVPKAKEAQALLQARHDSNLSGAKILEEGSQQAQSDVNPSGAAAPLDETGYSAVADRCCQAEMKQFIERQAINLGLELCDRFGLEGIVPYHSCEKGVQSFAALSSNLLDDSTSRCAWLATTGTCKARPADCPDFSGMAPAADCGCSRSKAAKVDLTGANIVQANNLGGGGPMSGPQELRYANVGVSDTGVPFDVVVTALSTYSGYGSNVAGVRNGFGFISLDPPTGAGMTTDFKFSFMQPNTNTPVTLSEVHMATFDLDGDAPNGIESAASKGYRGYVTDINPSVVASRLADGRTQFSSSGAVNDIPNPTDPNTLTADQRANSIMYFYANVSSFELSFGISTTAARNLFFSFASPLNDRCGP